MANPDTGAGASHDQSVVLGRVPELVAARIEMVEAAWSLADYVRRFGIPATTSSAVRGALLSLEALCPGAETTAELDAAAGVLIATADPSGGGPAIGEQHGTGLHGLIWTLGAALDRLTGARRATGYAHRPPIDVGELRMLAAIAARVNGGTPPDHPDRAASARYAALLHTYLTQGYSLTYLADVVGCTFRAIKFRLGRYGYRTLPPSMAHERVTTLPR
jgi:hypothetical protein